MSDMDKVRENQAKRVSAYAERIMHGSILSEKEYQHFIMDRLEKDNGYIVRKATSYDRLFAVDREMLFRFLNGRYNRQFHQFRDHKGPRKPLGCLKTWY